MFETTLQCMMLSMSEQGRPHIAHHVFVDMYVWNVHSVLAVVSKSAQKANHSPQLHLKPFMFDIPMQCSTARNLLLSASLHRKPNIREHISLIWTRQYMFIITLIWARQYMSAITYGCISTCMHLTNMVP